MDEALSENPPDGAVIDYWLKGKARGPVELEILDSEGTLVRRFARLALATDKPEYRPSLTLRGVSTLPVSF